MAERARVRHRARSRYRYPGAADAGAARRSTSRSTPGEFVVLAGRSGSGKSTLLRACCGLVPHFHGGEVGGAVEVAGLDTRDHGPAELGGAGRPASPRTPRPRSSRRRSAASSSCRSRCAASPPPRARGRSRRWRWRSRSRTCSTAPTDTLSGGELQRVALAAALVGAPAPGAARRADLAARPGRRRRADRAAAAAERGVGDGGPARRAPARALPGGRRPRGRAGGRARSPSTARPRGFLDWALRRRPGAGHARRRGCSRSPGCAPLPVGGEGGAARRLRRRAGRGSPAAERRARAARADGAPAKPPAGAGARRLRDLWVELDAGDGPRDVLRGHRPRGRAAASGSR